MIATAEALKRVLECHPAGLFIDPFPEPFYGIDREAAAVLAHAAKQLILPESNRLRVYVWERSAPTSKIDCSDVPNLKPDHGLR